MGSSLRFENLGADFDVLKDRLCERLKQPNEGDVILQSMQIELSKAPAFDRVDLQRFHDARFREWQRLKRSLVLGSAPPAAGSNEQWAQGRKILQDSNQSVLRAAQVAQENEAIGTEVITELGIQREALVRTRDRLTDANDDLTRTNKILRSMNRRVLTNKCLLIVIILLELAILSGVVYIRFYHNHKR